MINKYDNKYDKINMINKYDKIDMIINMIKLIW